MQKAKVVILFLALMLTPYLAVADILVANGSEITRYGDNGAAYGTFVSSAAIGLYYDSSSQKVFFSSSDGSINRANANGSNPIQLSNNSGTIIPDLVVVNNKIYWTDYTNHIIKRSDIDGTNTISLFTGVSFPHGIVYDSNSSRLFWAENGQIGYGNVDGSGSPGSLVVDTDGGQVAYLFINSGKIYWSNFDHSKIKRANIDGTGVTETLISGANATSAEGLAYSTALGKIVYLGFPSTGVSLRSMGLDGSSNAAIGSTAVTGYKI